MSESLVQEFYLSYWGGVERGGWIEDELGIPTTDFWCATVAMREALKARLQAVATQHHAVICFREEDGYYTRYKTTARMTMRLPDGRTFPYTYDAGYGDSREVIEFLFVDGNYSCDCNKSLLLRQVYGDAIAALPCGQTISIDTFSVSLDLPQS